MHGIPFAVVGCSAVLICPAAAQATGFAFTGAEQTYAVPAGVSNVSITAIGGNGGTPPPGGGVPGGRGAIVTGIVAVTPGQVLYVHVGGTGGLPDGGYNGGGTGVPVSAWGGGGASDVRAIGESAGGASVGSRLIVAAGGGGSAGIAAGGGDAGVHGGCCGAAGGGLSEAKPGTGAAGGAGGCGTSMQGCGTPGVLGRGGDGGSAAGPAGGGGGGGGLFGGGGGVGSPTDIGGGAGGSSLVPPGGTVGVTAAVARIDIDPYTPPPPPTATPVPTPTPTPVVLKPMATKLVYTSSRKGSSTRLTGFRLRKVPAGSTVVARCLTCKGKRGKPVTAKPTRTDIAIKAFDRTFPAGTRLEVVVSNPAYITQIKTLLVRKGKAPRVTTLCQAAGTAKRTRC